jgi:ribonuclease HI
VSPDGPGRGDPAVTRAYTDGACRGNPGPGGWAWAVPGGRWASGADPATTNQRMEILAALEAARSIDGPLVIVSDSTYVVHCWRDRWWEGWLARGWRNSRKEPVANRDLWEPLVEVFRTRDDLTLEWVKGHAGDEMNDLVDRLAVRASHVGHGASGDGPPAPELLGPPDGAGPDRSAQTPPGAQRARDSRLLSGWTVAVVGLRSASLAGSTQGAALTDQLARILAAQAELHPDLVVVSGLRAGAEEIGAAAAVAAGLPLAVVLPYPDPASGWSAAERRRFDATVAVARDVVTLERKRPTDAEGRRAALARRDGWLRSSVASAVVISDGRDAESELLVRRFTESLGDEVWFLDVPG